MLIQGDGIMKATRSIGIAAALAAATLASGPAFAAGLFKASLDGYAEVPAVSTTATGTARVLVQGDTLTYTLEYAGLEGGVQQAHIHLGQSDVNGGISAFLCTNLGNGPTGTQACPPAPATVSGTIGPGDVVGPADQGIDAGEIDELVRALEAGVTYVNVHSDLFPGGEIRGQLRRGLGR